MAISFTRTTASRSLLDDDVAELLRTCEPAKRLYGNLERARFVYRRLVEHARGDLHVLTLQRDNHVIGGKTERLQSVRIEPRTHHVVAAAENDERADAVNARDRIRDFNGRIIEMNSVSRDLSGE